MTISSCPKCAEQVTVPNNAPPSARVRCPLCQEEYILSEVLDKLPPALVLLDVPEVAGEAVGAAHDDDAGDYRFAADDGDTAVAESDESSGTPSFDFGGAGAESAAAGTAAAKPSFTATPRAKPRKKSPVIEIVKVVVGGVVGLFMAQMILWWIPISSLGDQQRDPVGFGRTIGQYSFISWIVPKNVRGDATLPLHPTKSNGGSTGTNNGAGQLAGGSSFGAATGANTKSNQPKTKGNSQLMTGPDFASDPTTLVGPDTSFEDDPFGLGAAPIPLDINATPTESPKPPEPEIKPPVPQPSDPEFVGVRNAPKKDTADLESAVQDARGAAQTYESSSSLTPAEIRTAARNFYESCALLGEVLAYVNQQDPNNSPHMEVVDQLLNGFATQPETIKLIEVISDQWLQAETPPNQGVILVGTVKEISVQGKIFETKVELSTKTPRTVAMVTATDPASFLKPDVRILLAGAVLKEPSLNLGGYTGNAEQVICGGYIVPIAPSAEPSEPSAEPTEPSAPSKPNEPSKPTESSKPTEPSAEPSAEEPLQE